MKDFDFNVAFTKLEDENILARGMFANEGVVTIITAPASSIDGETGPIIIEGADSWHVNVVYADEYVDAMVRDSIDVKEIAQSMRDISTIIGNGMHIGRSFLRSINQTESD
jgi:hypothetical protein